MSNTTDNSVLTPEDINDRLDDRLLKYEDLNFLERCGMYLGIAQLLEFDLKKLLAEKYDCEIKKMEEWSLGKVYSELEKNGIRPDFLQILKNTKDNRNYIAHELIANRIVMDVFFGKLIPENHYDKESRRLDKFIIELEQLVIIYNWINTNDGWG